MAIANWSRQDKIKRGVWAVAFAACIFVGSLTGAQMKSDTQKKESIKEFRATPPAEQIAILEDQKQALLEQRTALQRRIDLFNERVRERDAKKAGP